MIFADFIQQGQLDLVASVSTMLSNQDAPVVDRQLLAGERLMVLLGDDPSFAPRISTDLQLGASFGRHGGFAYEFSVLPLGVGFVIGRDSAISVGTGVAFEGATGGLDDGVLLPVEAQLDTGPFALRARFSIVGGRKDSAPSLFAQTELSAFAGWRIPTHGQDHVLVGVTYEEWLGARFAGLSVGWGLAAMAR